MSSGFIDEKAFEKASLEAEKTDRDITNILVEHGNISEEYLAEILADYFGVKFIALKKITIPDEVLKEVTEEEAKSQKLIPFELKDGVLKVAMEDPGDLNTIDFLKKETGKEIESYITTTSDLREALGAYKKSISADFTKIIDENVQKSRAQGRDIEQMAKDLPVINILNTYWIN